MPTLYHFEHSPFARRVRLALAYKGVPCELKEARHNPAFLAEARALVPTRTIPVFVDRGRAFGDSTVIVRWLDTAYPAGGRLWPEGEDGVDVVDTTSLVDVTLNVIIEVGTHYFSLRDSPGWPAVRQEGVGRVNQALEALAQRASSRGRPTLLQSGWSAADIWLYTMTAWIEGWPARVSSSQNAAQLVTIGVQLPAALSRWADAHRERPDVRSLASSQS